MARILLLLFLPLALTYGQSAPDSLVEPSMPVEEETFEVEKPEMVRDTGQATAEEALHVMEGNAISLRVKLAPIKSLLIPGLGEQSLGKKKTAKILMMSDGLLWTGFLTTLYLQYRKTKELRSYLYTEGRCDGVRSDRVGKNAWDLNENELELPLRFDSTTAYVMNVYKPARYDGLVVPDFYWSWSSRESYLQYYDLWKSRNSAKVTGYYFLGAALLARAGSFAYTRWLGKNMNTITPASEAEPALFFLPEAGVGYAGVRATMVF